MGKKYLIFGIAGFSVFVLDQLSKWIVCKMIAPGVIIDVIPGFFDLVNIRNRGAAFGFLNRSDIEWQFWLFSVATLIAAFVIILIVRSANRQPLLVLAMGMILGGALGNFMDRIMYRSVVDFLDFYWGDWHWPAFNIADMGICAGAFLACAVAWRKNPEANQ